MIYKSVGKLQCLVKWRHVRCEHAMSMYLQSHVGTSRCLYVRVRQPVVLQLLVNPLRRHHCGQMSGGTNQTRISSVKTNATNPTHSEPV